ncbi:uracil-DNA glycosylase [Mesobacillus sp. AQ2]|uniref:uracil-DNA glycosylase n=1 Tax=unclassified Mesobacillus TaxID=2675270 RepID=UPI0020409184|nr:MULTISPECIES: uracil-DNA glycosylase [unclassified Mesobacillus]MCM3123696.1 uracil-DNA glycosylase [Mesobacillus sp. MER 33]MCM3234289.1 uracil-DNA glycosylase [Mesobacillus sp. MER 48]WHX40528.1 uracil-DNA glycosylase [Mesobacillus sp. AQ2]
MRSMQNGWAPLLAEEFEKAYYLDLREFLMEEYQNKTVYPDKEDIFNALRYTDYDKVKVVILGQDPYHGPGQAHGLSFSVKPEVEIPPSLRNMFKELKADLGCEIPNHGYLKKWADQGVLLLNTVLTVRKGEAHSHKGKGWETFTDKVITLLNDRQEPVIFILWGKPAQSKLKLIDESKHKIITSAHPSPLSARRGFFGSKPFSRVNEILREWGRQEIDWQIDDMKNY